VKLGSLLAALAAGTVVLLAAGTPSVAENGRGRVVDAGHAPREVAVDRWQEVTARFEAAGSSADQLFVAADAASALAIEVRTAGWTSPGIPRLVDALVGTANPDGGYGLARAWDAYQDGTVNPATTSYTATTAGHVGPILLAGYLAGVVPAAVVDRALDWVLDLPPAPGDPCIPYSASPFDTGKACVWNVHFGAASWVRRASAATGHRPADAAALVARVTSVLDTVRPDPVTGYLPYSSAQTRPQDIGHQLWTSLSIDDLRGGSAAVTTMIDGPLWRVQARRFRDYNVASAMSGIALVDCRYATDRTVLTYAGGTARGDPYAFKALAAQSRQVATQCFTASGRSSAKARTQAAVALPMMNLG
jgi:hypothetical protein